MDNLSFFKSCIGNEQKATIALFNACESKNIDYKPHEVNRSAREIIEHITTHLIDLNVILDNPICDETLTLQFNDVGDAANQLSKQWELLLKKLENYSAEKWESENVELLVAGKPFATLPRMQMMWFFFFDIIHHRGQLSSYIRPMGGKNPAVYGYSADTI